MKTISTLVSTIVLIISIFILVSPAKAASLSNDLIQINEVLYQFREGWNQHDVDKLASIWDFDRDRITYIAVESDDIIQGGKNITQYYQNAVPLVASVELANILIDRLGDYAQVVGKADFIINNEDGSTYTAPVRVNFTLEKKGDRYLTIHYAESATVK